MKLLKTLLPLVGTVATAASIAPLATSCSTNSNTLQYNFSYDYRSIDGLTPYEPKFEPLAQQSIYPDFDDLYQLYGGALNKNWAIYADDLLCGTYASLLAIVQDEDCVLETMNGSVKITVDNFELTKEISYEEDFAARISWTEEWNLENVWTVELDTNSSHTYHGGLYRKVQFKNIPMHIGFRLSESGQVKVYWCELDPNVRSNDKKWSVSLDESANIDGSIDSASFSWDHSNPNKHVYFHDARFMRIHELFDLCSYNIIKDANGDNDYCRAGHYVLDGEICVGCHYMSKNFTTF